MTVAAEPRPEPVSLSAERQRRRSDSSRAQAPPVDGIPATEPDLLRAVAETLSSTLDLRSVLHNLADMALKRTGANRASIFLVAWKQLIPAVALGQSQDAALWHTFRSMPPIDLADISTAESLLRRTDAVVIPDATDSPLIPDRWAAQFNLATVVLVPLLVAGEPCGLLVLDYPTCTITVEQIGLLEALASYAAVAVRNARLFESTTRRANIHRELARCGRELTKSSRDGRVAETLVEACTRTLGATSCTIGLFDRGRTRISLVAASRRTDDAQTAQVPIQSLPTQVVEQLTTTWSSRLQPVEFGGEAWLAPIVGAGFAHHVLLPLTVDGQVVGAIALGLDDPLGFGDEERQAAGTLGAMASAILERNHLLQRSEANVRRLEALAGVSEVLMAGADADAVVRRLRGVVGPEGVEVVEIALHDPTLRLQLRAQAPTPEERRLNGRRPTTAELPAGLRAIPLLLNKRVMGTMRVRARDLSDDDEEFLMAIGRGVADVITRGALRASLNKLDVDRAAASVREVMSANLNDTLSHFFVSIGLLARNHIELLPADSRMATGFREVAALADGGKWEVDQGARALACVPTPQRRLAVALTDLGASFSEDSGISLLVDCTPNLDALRPDVERVLYRVAHEAMINAWRHGRCTMVRVDIALEGETATLEVRDDGIGFPMDFARRSNGVGLTMVRRLLHGVHGTLDIGNGRPRGARLVATVPTANA